MVSPSITLVTYAVSSVTSSSVVFSVSSIVFTSSVASVVSLIVSLVVSSETTFFAEVTLIVNVSLSLYSPSETVKVIVYVPVSSYLI